MSPNSRFCPECLGPQHAQTLSQGLTAISGRREQRSQFPPTAEITATPGCLIIRAVAETNLLTELTLNRIICRYHHTGR